MKKYCTKCGRQFEAVGREVICPSCKAQAAEETKRAAVERAKLASWTGESVPVRISGRASTVIREYGAAHTMTFVAALDALLQASDYFASLGKAWEDVEPYKSRRRDRHATETAQDEQAGKQDAPQASKPQGKAQDAPQTAQDVPHDVKQASKPQDVQTAQDVTSKPQAAKVASNASASKASASKTATSKTSKASKTSK